MKHLVFFVGILMLLACTMASAQEAVYNFGSLQLHPDGNLGFHTNLVNDGDFDQNKGLVGFYTHSGQLSIGGQRIPRFYDAEVAVDADLILETSIGITNNGNLISGDIFTPRTRVDISSNFFDDAFYTGESSTSKVNGYVALFNKSDFIFPVGDAERLRPLTMASLAINPMAKCAYFFENPNAPQSLQTTFSTERKASSYLSVSNLEFWRLEGDVPAMITLTWDGLSNIPALGVYLSDLKVVGWSKQGEQWVNLGNTATSGGLEYGTVTSGVFLPSEYEILTIGGNDTALEKFETIELANYFMTPDGDGRNDLLILDGMEKSPRNNLQIFDRYGVLVYSKDNYNNDFNGTSNRQQVVQRGKGLDNGIYFYVIALYDLRQKHQGYLYISN